MLITELERFIEEDIGPDDTSCSIAPDVSAHAAIITKEDGILAGLKESHQIFNYFKLESNSGFNDADTIQTGDIISEIRGPAREILRAERLALNFLCKMSGIATFTAGCVKLAGNVRVACTRKTTPGFRKFEKKAVRLGGGDSHRYNLSDAIMIKDNHIAIMNMEEAVIAARKVASFTKKIEVEVSNHEDMLSAAHSDADIIMFDNMQPDEIRYCITMLKNAGLRNGTILESSGGITDKNIADFAATGVDVISMSSLIHSARWMDMSLKIK